MRGAEFDLAALLRPIEPAAFFRDTWEKQPLAVCRDEPGYYGGLFSLRDVDSVIAFTRPRFTDPGLFKPDGPPSSTYVQGLLADDEQAGRDNFPGVAEVHQAFERGKTVILTAMQHRWPPVAALCRRLEATFGCTVHTNLYLTPPGAQGFNAHYDTHEVFVLQAEGFKHWRLYGPARALPLADERASLTKDRVGPPTQEVLLKAGDLLYIPRGHVHDAFTSACASLHLTVGIQVWRWADLLGHALADVCARDERFRASLPPGLLTAGEPPADLQGKLRELLESLAGSARADDAVQRLAEAFFRNLPVLPDGRFAAGADVERIDLDTPLERAPGMICRVVPLGGRVGIAFPGGWVEGPAKIASALHFVARASRFAARSLPDDLTPTGKLTLVRRLVRERLLTVADGMEA
jgi:hypothetical protein